jgi:hypothetical protein
MLTVLRDNYFMAGCFGHGVNPVVRSAPTGGAAVHAWFIPTAFCRSPHRGGEDGGDWWAGSWQGKNLGKEVFTRRMLAFY